MTAQEVLARLDELATHSDTPGAITRLFLTPAHLSAVALVQGWMEQAGLRAWLDASGTLVGRREGPAPDSPLLILGSHIDTVRNAGRHDGCLGVVAAIAVAGRLRAQPLPYALEIRAFGDEEGVRFPVTLTGSRATAGRFDPSCLAALDADGISLQAALHARGLGGDALAANACRASRTFAYLELHIEQGPVLELQGLPLGVVTAINGAARFTVTVQGEAGHAGTVPMPMRRDALVAAAAMVLAIRQVARAQENIVATVGQFAVSPGAVNVIPGACVFTIDLRAPDDALRNEAESAMRTTLADIAQAHGTSFHIELTHQAKAVACDPRLRAVLADAIAAAGVNVRHLPSGAGHDAMAVADLCPVGMLFVRCTGGISHHPDEAVLAEDVAVALDVLTLALRALDPARFALG